MAAKRRSGAARPAGVADKATRRPIDLRREFAAGYPIARLARLIARNANRRVADLLGLTLAEWRVLLVLDEDSGSQLEEVARRGLLETSHASVAAAGLVRKGLVARRELSVDRRRANLRRTAAGTRAVGRYLEATAAERRAFWGVLSGAEQRTLVALLDRLIDAAVAGGYDDGAVGFRRRTRG